MVYRLPLLLSKLFNNRPAPKLGLRAATREQAMHRHGRTLRPIEALEERTLLSAVIGTLYEDLAYDGQFE